MKPCKKILSLALTAAALLSLSVVGAGAAFTDQDGIQHADAVSACTELQIISGYPDNSFQPDGSITRGQMCKMLCVALNGGKEPDLSQVSPPAFQDTAGNWAEPYIKYCVANGLANGMNQDTFAPDQNITPTQAAKMLLNALGYASDKEGFTGGSWSSHVHVRAQSAKLYENLGDLDTAKPLSRDDAAQMIVNALQAVKVEYTEKTEVVDGKNVTGTVCSEKLDQDGKTPLTLLKEAYGMSALPAGK